MTNTLEEIQLKYHDEIESAIAEHEAGVREYNAKLASDLEGADASEKPFILAAFEEEVSPLVDAFHAATEKAETERVAEIEKVTNG